VTVASTPPRALSELFDPEIVDDDVRSACEAEDFEPKRLGRLTIEIAGDLDRRAGRAPHFVWASLP
jgi:hypothetical protein